MVWTYSGDEGKIFEIPIIIPGTTPENIRLYVAEGDETESVLILPGEGGDIAPPLSFVIEVKQDVKYCVLMEQCRS